MTFATLSGTAVLAGLALLAAGLFALQQLRTRYRDVTVVTTLFWKQALDEAPVRTLRERFRHPLAYALILAICSLLWLAFAEPVFEDRDDRTFHVLVLDGSAGMAAGTRFTDAVAALERHVAGIPAARRQVIWSGADIRSLLQPGEHALLLRERLRTLAPEAAPASLERALRQVSTTARGEGTTAIRVFGDAPVRRQVIDLLPAGTTVTRAAASAPLSGNRGITALGVADAASGIWDRVDVHIGVERSDDRAADTALAIEATLDGQAVTVQAAAAPVASGARGFIARDLPASGGMFAVRLTGTDTLALDDAASVRLPVKPVLRVALAPSLAPVLRPALEADRGVTVVAPEAAADVVMRRAGDTFGGNIPALEFVRAASQPQAFLLTHPDAFDAHAVFESAVENIGLTQIDAMTLAEASGRPIEVSVQSGTAWRFSVWEDLLTDDFNFTRSRAFPVFIANAARWLAGVEAWPPFVAAGQPLTIHTPGDAPGIVDARGRRLDTLGVSFVPPRAGEIRVAGRGRPLQASLLDPAVTRGSREPLAELRPAGVASATSDAGLVTWLLLIALGLLAAEWYYFQMGRLP